MDFCGCCGRQISCSIQDGFSLWCFDCYSHVLHHGPLADRTYFAIHGKPCPFEEPPDGDDGEPLGIAA